MSVLTELHEAHKERQARMGGTNAPVLMLARIIKVTARYYGVTISDLISTRRTAKVVIPRQVAMYLCRNLTTRSLPEIGRAIGHKDHTTVLYGVRQITDQLVKDEILRDQVNELTELLKDEFDGAVDWKELERDVAAACSTIWTTARELEGYRRHGGARRFLKAPELMDDLEKARDYISRTLDDMRGVK